MEEEEDTIPIMADQTGSTRLVTPTEGPNESFYRRGAWTVHFLSLLCLILVVTWFSMDSGYSWDTGNAAVFSWHPTLMTVGFLVCFPQAAIVYRWLLVVDRPTRKGIHALLHLIALISVTIGLVAVFRFHNEKSPPIPNMYSLHSWLGISTVGCFYLQYILGFLSFAFPKFSLEFRTSFVPVHANAGLLILSLLVSSTVCMGVLEKMTFQGYCNQNGHSTNVCYIANCFGIASVLLIGVTSFIIVQPKYHS